MGNVDAPELDTWQEQEWLGGERGGFGERNSFVQAK